MPIHVTYLPDDMLFYGKVKCKGLITRECRKMTLSNLYAVAYYKVDCGARDLISLKKLVRLQFKMPPPLRHKRTTESEGNSKASFSPEYDAG